MSAYRKNVSEGVFAYTDEANRRRKAKFFQFAARSGMGYENFRDAVSIFLDWKGLEMSYCRTRLCQLFTAFCMIGLSGCSTAAWYDFFQSAAQSRCSELKTDVDRRSCLARNSYSYETYKKEREGTAPQKLNSPPTGTPPFSEPVVPLPAH
jgi:hypothetical protein